MDTEKRKTKAKPEIELGGTFKKILLVQIDDKAKRAKEARIREALTERVKQKEKARPFALKVKALTGEVERLRKEAESLQEEREVRCQLEYDWNRREVHTIRLDTKKRVPELTRTMNDGDKQKDLLAKPKRKTRAAKPAPVATDGEIEDEQLDA